MIRAFRFSLSILAIALAAGLAARADAPHVYAITGARLVTVAGPAVAVRNDRRPQRPDRGGRRRTSSLRPTP